MKIKNGGVITCASGVVSCATTNSKRGTKKSRTNAQNAWSASSSCWKVPGLRASSGAAKVSALNKKRTGLEIGRRPVYNALRQEQGQLAQRESASLTRRRSQVRNLCCPPRNTKASRNLQRSLFRRRRRVLGKGTGKSRVYK